MNDQASLRRSRQLLSITIIFFWASEYCHAPYFTPYLQTLGFAANLIGILTGAYGFTQLIVRIPLGIATDVTGYYKKTIVMGTVFTTVSSFGLIFARHFVTILFCRVLAGLAASTWLAFTVLYNAYYAADESVRAMTNVNAFNSAGKFLAFILGLATASVWGYRIPLVCSFLTGVAAIICACSLKPITLKRESFQLKHVVHVLTNPAILSAAFFAIIVQFFQQGTVYSFTSAAARSLGASAFEIGLSTVLFTIVQIVGAKYIGSRLLKRLSTIQAIVLGTLSMSICCLLVGFAPNMLPIYLSQIIGGISGLIMNSVLMAIIVRYTPQEKQSTAMGLYQALYGIGMTAGPVCVGAIVEASSFQTAYLVVGVITTAAAVIALPLLKKTLYLEK